MQQFTRKMFGETGWGIPGSILLHLVLAFLLLMRLPELPSAPEPSVNVELVPPPPAPEKPREKPDDTAQSRPPPQAFETASAQAEPETPHQPDRLPAAPSPDENPQQTPPSTAQTQSPDSQPPAQDSQSLMELRAPSDSTDSQNESTAPPNPPVPQKKPTPEKPETKAAAEQQADTFTQAQKLYSKDALADPRVKQAIGKLSPQERVIQICSIEALEQIRHRQPGAFPDMLARDGGSVSDTGLTVSNGAFRSRAQWYAVDFKCQVDAEAMSIRSFRYAIGQPIPEREWSERQLPRD